MPHFKRSGPKSTRAGCLMCKPHKHQGMKGQLGSQTLQEQRAILSEDDFEDECRVPSRAKRGPKNYVVEKRELSPSGEPSGAWFVYRRYRTPAGQEAAVRSLSASARGYAVRWGGGPREEFRAQPE
jgi:hypothetical protein